MAQNVCSRTVLGLFCKIVYEKMIAPERTSTAVTVLHWPYRTIEN